MISQSPEYMAKMGVKAEGGPSDGKHLDCSGLLIRHIEAEGGWYRLRGKADGSLVYKYEADSPR